MIINAYSQLDTFLFMLPDQLIRFRKRLSLAWPESAPLHSRYVLWPVATSYWCVTEESPELVKLRTPRRLSSTWPMWQPLWNPRAPAQLSPLQACRYDNCNLTVGHLSQCHVHTYGTSCCPMTRDYAITEYISAGNDCRVSDLMSARPAVLSVYRISCPLSSWHVKSGLWMIAPSLLGFSPQHATYPACARACFLFSAHVYHYECTCFMVGARPCEPSK